MPVPTSAKTWGEGATAVETPLGCDRHAAGRRPSGCGQGIRVEPPPQPTSRPSSVCGGKFQIKPSSTTGQQRGAWPRRRGGPCAKPRPRACAMARTGGDERGGRLAGVEPGRRTRVGCVDPGASIGSHNCQENLHHRVGAPRRALRDAVPAGVSAGSRRAEHVPRWREPHAF
jgi:hypothetical protein